MWFGERGEPPRLVERGDRVSDNEYDVIVIGAGYGGVTAAALCAKQGKRVLLVDKNDRAGGKAMTIERRGYKYEMWPVWGTPANNSRMHELAAAIGAESRAKLYPPLPDASEGRYKAPSGEWRGRAAEGGGDQTQDPMGVSRMKEMYGATDDDLVSMAELFNVVMTASEEEIDDFDTLGMLPWIRSFGVPEGIVSFLCSMLNLVFVSPVNRIPVSEGIRTLRDLYTNTGGRYHGDGVGKLAEYAADYVVAQGGTFLAKTRVERVIVEDGRVAGIATADGEYRAPVVVSNAGIQPTILALVDRGALPEAYVERIRSLEPGWGLVGARYFLDAPVMKGGMATAYSDQSWWDDDRYAAAERGEWPDAALVFVGIPTNYDASLAPAGHQIIQMGTLGSADPKSPMNEVAIEKAEATMRECWPEIFEHLIRRETYTAASVSNLTRDSVVPGQGGECIGLAQVIGQCGRSKPDARTPLEGLYITGCDAGGFGCGTHQAVDSGFKVAAMVGADLDARVAKA